MPRSVITSVFFPANSPSDHAQFETLMPEQGHPSADTLESRLDFETLIANLSSRFIHLLAGEVDQEIMDAERKLCEFLGLVLSALWQWSDEAPGLFTPTHLYSALESPQPPGRLKQEDFSWAVRKMLADRNIAISSLEDRPVKAAGDREGFRRLGINSILSLPFTVGAEPLIGALYLNTPRAERNGPDALVNLHHPQQGRRRLYQLQAVRIV
jgi:hypothetical protein